MTKSAIGNRQSAVAGVPIVLASASPRRRELLGLLGLVPEVVPAHLEEIHRPGEAPRAYVERLAREKATAVHRPDAVVVAADTTVELDGVLLEKPADEADAAAMLRRLQGREHMVHTAIAVAWDGKLVSGVETTKVWFRPMDERLITEYVATREPMDKAGAYGIQGYGAVLVERIEGDYFTVMGLGLSRLVALMAQVGIAYHFGRLAPV
jgi:septum formation protein